MIGDAPVLTTEYEQEIATTETSYFESDPVPQPTDVKTVSLTMFLGNIS